MLLDVALHTATTMVAALSAVSGCQRCAYAGSLRRMRETIGDIDILAAAQDSGPQGPLSLTETRIIRGSTGEKWCRTRSI